ncbi:hypothetical protein [Enterovirga rhinocerotis]|uniref:4-amino-4-deoxy-L-arabinose transferase-like glycosyltransferase n=1 Tax=Enterovirga rhinocerotis TaxID=1339210 RepID=A0A4R7C088_9HYPH|nr:hypothetical protein [Enterovirga rhinocerotis]TDR89887.1 hypothetical protein EV668_2723 [Enterovirga rhinocerotis]
MAKAGFSDASSPTRPDTTFWPMIAVVLAVAALGLMWERVPQGGGLGWDGTIYARMVADLGGMVASGELSAYHAQRILPALAVKGMLAVVGAAPTDSAILWAFSLYNLALMLASLFLWRAVADVYALGTGSRWIGFCALFLSFQAAKLTYYYPPLTDMTALTFGLLTLFLYATRRPALLMLVSILGASSWPTLSVCGALLILFPRPEPGAPPAPETPLRLRPLVTAYLAVAAIPIALYLVMIAAPAASCAVAAPPLVATVETLTRLGIQSLKGGEVLGEPCAAVRRLLTSIPSVLAVILGLAAMLVPLATRAGIAWHVRRIRPLHVIYAVLTILVPILVVKLIANPSAPTPSSIRYLALIIMMPPEGKVFMPLVGTFVYWGPLVLVAIPLWQEFCRAVRGLGLGAVLTIAFTLPFGLVGEGRFLTAAWPFMVLAMALVLNQRPLGRAFWIAFLVATVALAQFWLPLNIGPWTGGSLEHLLEFPKQMYFMHFGPWMNWATFSLQFVFMALVAAWLYATLPRRRQPETVAP